MTNLTLELIETANLLDGSNSKRITVLLATGEIELATISIVHSHEDKMMGITIDDICDSQTESFDMLHVISLVISTLHAARVNNTNSIESAFGNDGLKILSIIADLH